MINERIFGSPIPEKVKQKLEDRQNVAGDVAFGNSVSAVFPDKDGNNQADLSSRTPFVRMWTGLRLIDPAEIFNNDPAVNEITTALLEANDISYTGTINFDVCQKLINKVMENSNELIIDNQAANNIIYNSPKIVESRDWKQQTSSPNSNRPSQFFIIGNITRDQINTARKIYIVGDVNYQKYYNAVTGNTTLEQEHGIALITGGTSYLQSLPTQRANLININGGPVPSGTPARSKGRFPGTSHFRGPAFNYGLTTSAPLQHIGSAVGDPGHIGKQDDTTPGGFRQELGYNPLFKPLAGITSLSSETEGALGVIKKTTVNFKVNNFYDFDDIYNRFFLKPGATIFVDFGWSSISNLYNPKDILTAYDPDDLYGGQMNAGVNNSYGQTKSSPLVNMYEKLYYEPNKANPNDKKPEGIITKEAGDLEVLQGIVTDYSSKINSDGSVDCSVTLTSANSAILNSNNGTAMTAKITSLLKQGILFYGLIPTVDDESSDVFDPTKDSKHYDPTKTVEEDKARCERHSPGEWDDSITERNKKCRHPNTKVVDDNDLKELLAHPNTSFSATNEQQYFKNLQMLALKELSGRFGPNGNAIRTGVFVDSLNAENTFISWGLFEDLVINSFFGFGADVQAINKGKNFNVRLDSSNSFTGWTSRQQLKQQVLLSVPEEPPKTLYPIWWGNGDPDYSGGYNKKHNVSLSNGSYTYQRDKRPFDYKEKETQFGIDSNKTGTRAQELYDEAFEEETAGGVIIDHSEIDKYFNRIPLREVFVSVTTILSAFNRSKSVKKIIAEILKELNTSSYGMFQWKLISGDTDSEFKVIDMHYLQSNQDLKEKIIQKNPNAGLMDLDDDDFPFFQFNIMSPNSIVKDYNLEFKLPSNAIGNMYAISGMSHNTSIFPVDDVTEQVTGITALDEQHNRIIYEPDMGSYRIEQIDKNKNESVDFNIYQTVKQLTSQEYFTVGANITDNVIATGGMTGSGAIKSPKKKIGAAPAKSEPPTTQELIKINDDLMVSLGMQVATTFETYFKFLNVADVVHDNRPNLLPYTLSLRTYGISSIVPGDTFTVDYLPIRHLNNTFLQVMRVKHDVNSDGWYTELETQYRLLPNKKTSVYKNYSAQTHQKVRLSASSFERLNINNLLSEKPEDISFFGLFTNNSTNALKALAPYLINCRVVGGSEASAFDFSITCETRDNFDGYNFSKNGVIYNSKYHMQLLAKGFSTIAVRFDKVTKKNNHLDYLDTKFPNGWAKWGPAGGEPPGKIDKEDIEAGKIGCYSIKSFGKQGASPGAVCLPPFSFKQKNHKFEIIYMKGFVGVLDMEVTSYQQTRDFFSTYAQIYTPSNHI